MSRAPSLPSPLSTLIAARIAQAGGWLPFDRFMALALYAPGLGYYAGGRPKFGRMPGSGSDFVTAPELSPLFGASLAEAVGQALDATGTREVWEFGAGSGALAAQLLEALAGRVDTYHVVELSAELRERQAARLAAHGSRVHWHAEWPESLEGVVVGNEVLDAMPVKLLSRASGAWHERGVVVQGEGFAFDDRPTALRPPVEVAGDGDYLTEIQPQARAFVASLAERLLRSERGGAAFFIDYGFPEAEYYHPQRIGGTLMCHLGHRADPDPLVQVGDKDITAHVDFTGIALAGQEAGLTVLGYTSQARFLFNSGLGARMDAASLPERVHAARLVQEHEMGELFKVVGFATAEGWQSPAFAAGDRSHTL